MRVLYLPVGVTIVLEPRPWDDLVLAAGVLFALAVLAASVYVAGRIAWRRDGA